MDGPIPPEHFPKPSRDQRWYEAAEDEENEQRMDRERFLVEHGPPVGDDPEDEYRYGP